MSSKTSIEWTSTINTDGTVTPGSTWNPVRGCTEISPGCAHCYAKTFAERWRGVKGHPYEQGFDPRLVPEKLDEPLRWKRPRMVFVNSMSDLFHEDVPDSFIDSVFRVMFEAKQHTFQILTKRAERMRKYTSDRWGKFGGKEYPLAENIWLGVSCEDQKRADERIPLLLQTPAAVRFLSCEPLLGQIELVNGKGWCKGVYGYLTKQNKGSPHENHIDWVIVGGESGPGARPCNIDWIRDIVRQCQAASVPCFVKQLGSKPMYERPAKEAGTTEVYVNGLKDKKGGTMSEWPEDLRVREFPK